MFPLSAPVAVPGALWICPQFVRFRSGYLLGRVVILCRLFQLAQQVAALTMRLDAWSHRDNVNRAIPQLEAWFKPLVEAGLGEWTVDGAQGTWTWSPILRQETPAAAPAATETPAAPRPRWPSDDPQYRASRRAAAGQPDSASDSANAPQATPQSAPPPTPPSRARVVSETREPTFGNVSETVPETEGDKSQISEWRKQSEDLARQSARELIDRNSLGYHILVWNHARKMDRQRVGKGQPLTDGVFEILRDLTDRVKQTGAPQGAAWTQRTQAWFADNGVPLAVKPTGADAEELAEAHAALAHLRDDPPEVDPPPLSEDERRAFLRRQAEKLTQKGTLTHVTTGT